MRVPTILAHTIFLRKKTPASRRARGGTPTTSLALGANREGEERVKGVVVVVVDDSHISAIDLSNANPACGHKQVRRSTGHIMVTTRYSDQQGSKSRQNVMRLYKQWHRQKSKRFIKPPYSISRATSIDSECCRLRPAFAAKKTEQLRSNQF